MWRSRSLRFSRKKRYGSPGARVSRDGLHRAASYLGARAVRAEARARARHEALAQESAGMVSDAREWSVLDDELSALGAKEREALVLHYFEDRGYAEMAATLGLSEAAARR